MEKNYGIAIYHSDIRKIAELNLYVRENDIQIDRMEVLSNIHKCHIRKIDKESVEYGKKNPHNAELPNYLFFEDSLSIQLKLIEQYWDMFKCKK